MLSRKNILGDIQTLVGQVFEQLDLIGTVSSRGLDYDVHMSHSTQMVLNLFASVSILVLYTFLFGPKGAEVTFFCFFVIEY